VLYVIIQFLQDKQLNSANSLGCFTINDIWAYLLVWATNGWMTKEINWTQLTAFFTLTTSLNLATGLLDDISIGLEANITAASISLMAN
jgi:hypothetical protein